MLPCSGLSYQPLQIVIYSSESVKITLLTMLESQIGTPQLVACPIYDASIVNYDHRVFIVQATGVSIKAHTPSSADYTT